VLRNAGLDKVIIVSPMSADIGLVRGPDAMIRWGAHRRLQREIAHLKESGTEVISIEPGSRSRSAMGLWPMAEDRSDRVVRAALEEASELPVELRSLGDKTRSGHT
jgi:hypothetical protein